MDSLDVPGLLAYIGKKNNFTVKTAKEGFTLWTPAEIAIYHPRAWLHDGNLHVGRLRVSDQYAKAEELELTTWRDLEFPNGTLPPCDIKVTMFKARGIWVPKREDATYHGFFRGYTPADLSDILPTSAMLR